jgi:hypothetical protein
MGADMSKFTGFRVHVESGIFPDRGVIEYSHEIIIGASVDKDGIVQASSAGGWFSALPRSGFADALRALANFIDIEVTSDDWEAKVPQKA